MWDRMEFCPSTIHRFFITVEPPTPTDKFLCSQDFLDVKTRLKCLSRCVNSIHRTHIRHFSLHEISAVQSAWIHLSFPDCFKRLPRPTILALWCRPGGFCSWKWLEKNTYKHNICRTLAFVTVCWRNFIQIRWCNTKPWAPGEMQQQYPLKKIAVLNWKNPFALMSLKYVKINTAVSLLCTKNFNDVLYHYHYFYLFLTGWNSD